MSRCMKCMGEYSGESGFCPYCGCVPGGERKICNALPVGTMLAGRYIVGEALGGGGFGIVYIAFDEKLEKRVAIKEFLPGEYAMRNVGETEVNVYMSSEKTAIFKRGLSNFIDEARRLAKFGSAEGIVQIYDVFAENSTAYFVMEYLESSLKERIDREGRLPWDEAVEIMLPVLKALSLVHKKGIVHRDISPQNIMFTDDGRVKLIDFGAARFETSIEDKTHSVILKAGYAPIEQYSEHGNQGSWTDVYAAAATLYTSITGKKPPAAVERSVDDKLVLPSESGIAVPEFVEAALISALNVRIDGRTRTADEFARQLRGEVSPPLPPPVPPIPPKPTEERESGKSKEKSKGGKQKNRYIFVIAALSVVLVAVIALLAFISRGKKDNTDPNLPAQSALEANADVEWRPEYEKLLQKLIENKNPINAVYIGDLNGDEIPVVALSTDYPAHKIANTVIAFANGRVVKLGLATDNYGNSCYDEVLFCEGTSYVIYRTIGVTTGTLGTNSQQIYELAPAGSDKDYVLLREDIIEFTAQQQEEIAALNEKSADFDTTEYVAYIKAEQDKIVDELSGGRELVNFAESAEDFGTYSDTETIDIVKPAVDYINEKLRFNLEVKDSWFPASWGDEDSYSESGSCGKNVKWYYYKESATLVVRGAGSMRNYDDEETPWPNGIKKLVVEEGVTSIGNFAFYCQKRLAAVNMADSVTYISTAAFMGCNDLEKINLSENLTEIGVEAFEDCEYIETIVLPDKLNIIGDSAFNSCYRLKRVDIPANVNTIGEYAFLYCFALEGINVSSDNVNYSSVDGVLFSDNGKSLIQYPAGKSGEYSVPIGVEIIEVEAFYDCDALVSINIPSTVVYIENSAFSYCDSLSEIKVDPENEYYSDLNGVLYDKDVTTLYCYPGGKTDTSIKLLKSVTRIAEYAFCNDENYITDVYYEGTFVQWSFIEHEDTYLYDGWMDYIDVHYGFSLF